MAADQDFDDFDDDEVSDGTEMSFLGHLEELRWHILRSVASFFVFAVAAWFFREFIFSSIILGPTKTDFYTNQILCQAAELFNMPSLCMKHCMDFFSQGIDALSQN